MDSRPLFVFAFHPAGAPRRRSPRTATAWWLARSTLGATLLLLAAACATNSQEEVSTAVVGTTEDFETINELIALGSSFNDAILDRLFLQLVVEQPDSNLGPATFRPRLASAWEFSENREILTFTLRDDVSWSDGVPVTAADVLFSFEAQTSSDVRWNYAYVKDKITSVEVVDDFQVRFHFSAPSATQLEDANEGLILPAHVWSQLPFSEWRQQPQWFLEHPLAAGPFVLESWKPQQRLVLSRNPRYFEPLLPRLDRVVFLFIPEASSLVAQLLAGDLDFVPRVAAADAQQIESDPRTRLIAYQTRQYNFISWNTRRPQFAQAAVRRALALAIDRKTILDTLWFGYAKIGSSPIVSSFWAHDPNLEPWPYDPAEARRILDQQGWIDRNGDGIRDRQGVAFSFELTTNPGDDVRWDAMQMVRAQLRDVGIEAIPRRIEYQTLNALNLAHDYDATLTAFLMDTTLDLSYAFHSDAIDNGYNFGSYSNPEVDRLIEEVNAQLDPRAALPMLYRIQQILHQEQPMLFLWEPDNMVGTSAELGGVSPNMISEYYRMEEWKKSTTAPR